MKKVYIIATSAISPQDTFDSEQYFENVSTSDIDCFKCNEPDYKSIINSRLLRRMARIIKMGVATAVKSLQTANVENPEAIIVGTGLGCLEDTEKFLVGITNDSTGIQSPTPFIQSTHNSIAGQISLILKSHAFSYTYTQRGHSFENALQDAILQMEEGKENILVGGIDEVVPSSISILNQLRCRKNANNHVPIGEGASFFLLSSKEQNKAFAEIAKLETIYNPRGIETISSKLREILANENLKPEEIDVILFGYNGISEDDNWYNSLKNELLKENNILRFKDLGGEYFTSIAFGLNLGANMMKRQKIFNQSDNHKKTNINNLLIYNHHKGKYHTFILLKRCPDSIS